MDIFKDYRQAVHFAFSLAHQADLEGLVSRASLVTVALNEAHVNVPRVLLDAPTLEYIGRFGDEANKAIELGLSSHERDALIAAYSRDWEARRQAAGRLQPSYRIPLTSWVSNQHLVDKLVKRHYIAVRDRGNGWSIPEICDEFKASIGRVTTAVREIERIAKELETLALATLAQRVQLPVLEADHA